MPAVRDPQTGTYSGGTRCPAVADDGKPCQKPLYTARDGLVWDHAGGHQFATDETWERVQTWHHDATSLLAGLPTAGHPPEQCPGPDRCTTARYREV